MAASPGAAVGRVVFDSPTAKAWAERGEQVVLVRKETNPDDLEGMIAANGILTARGGKTSHAAVVARGMGKTCVCGAEGLDVDSSPETARVGTTVIGEGDEISIDGSTGEVFLGAMPVVPSPVETYIEDGLTPPSTARMTKPPPWSRRSTDCSPTPTSGAGWRSGPTPTPPRTPNGRASSAPGHRVCAAPSTCSWVTAAR